MATGPGKYDQACVTALTETEAAAVVLIVLGGIHGSGFSVNTTDPEIVARLPELLREVANQIEGIN